MKSIIILCDGIADHPIQRLGGKTPLMAARTPHIDKLCAMGRTGRLLTVPAGMAPGSEVANLGVLGYNAKEVYQGRGVLEAASMGVELELTDLAMRCNLVCIENENIKNHSAGHISSEEGRELIKTLNERLGSQTVKFYPGVSYRHLLVIAHGNNDITMTPPHDVPGKPFRDVLPRATTDHGAQTAGLINELIHKSQQILQDHPVNQGRVRGKKDPGNSIWPWAAGYKPKMKTLDELFHVTGAVIAAVDLIKGIGRYAGMRVIEVPGATGLHDTNYEGKARAAVHALKDVDLVYLHIEASDEAGHEGDVDLKVRTVEFLDQRVVKYILEETARINDDVAIALLPDHPTPCELKTHTAAPVPFIIYHPGEQPDGVMEYNEESVKQGYYGLLEGDHFIRALLQK
ncbi:MAG: cofactor-independent phosphoglycerate mutase [Deltaproteobacteria bacterium]|nr:cofactor-independent phosphoglycerate mutase [Deltaproteobacteria bacterium]